eukprot:2724881-Rhodomonas_salina.9
MEYGTFLVQSVLNRRLSSFDFADKKCTAAQQFEADLEPDLHARARDQYNAAWYQRSTRQSRVQSALV